MEEVTVIKREKDKQTDMSKAMGSPCLGSTGKISKWSQYYIKEFLKLCKSGFLKDENQSMHWQNWILSGICFKIVERKWGAYEI